MSIVRIAANSKQKTRATHSVGIYLGICIFDGGSQCICDDRLNTRGHQAAIVMVDLRMRTKNKNTLLEIV